MIFGIRSKILNVDVRQTADQEFELLLVEYRYQSFGDYIVEAVQKGIQSEKKNYIPLKI